MWGELPTDIVELIHSIRASVVIQAAWRRFRVQQLCRRFRVLRCVHVFRQFNPNVQVFLLRSRL